MENHQEDVINRWNKFKDKYKNKNFYAPHIQSSFRKDFDEFSLDDLNIIKRYIYECYKGLISSENISDKEVHEFLLAKFYNINPEMAKNLIWKMK